MIAQLGVRAALWRVVADFVNVFLKTPPFTFSIKGMYKNYYSELEWQSGKSPSTELGHLLYLHAMLAISIALCVIH